MQDEVYDYIQQRLADMQTSIEDLEDDLPEYVWETEENLNTSDFDIPIMLDDTVWDLELLAKFIEDTMSFKPEHDEKIKELKRILTEDEHVKNRKVIIFTE